jgi:hypothetical protein
MTTEPDAPLFCARCATELRPGSGECYRVTIEAVADPTPPVLSGEQSAEDIRAEIERLLAAMKSVPEAELRSQVYRRLTLWLCNPCYTEWIEDPTG